MVLIVFVFVLQLALNADKTNSDEAWELYVNFWMQLLSSEKNIWENYCHRFVEHMVQVCARDLIVFVYIAKRNFLLT